MMQTYHIFGWARSFFQESTLFFFPNPILPSLIHLSSLAETPACSSGRSRYQKNQKADQATPMIPKRTNGMRQPQTTIIAATTPCVRAPASRDPEWVTPWANPRSEVASQREKARVALGNAPASPAPNRKRMTMNEAAFQAETVQIVNADHHNTIPDSMRRGPMRSTSQPLGT